MPDRRSDRRLACAHVLEELRIRGLGVIDDVVLPVGPGLTVVTGETGAGKTMVVTGLLLLFGGRADATRVRTGWDHAEVDGRLVVEPESAVARRVLDAGGALDDGGGLVLRRTVSAGGRSRAFAGGAPVPVAVLGEIGLRQVSVHGQSDQARLTRPAQQRVALDRVAGADVAGYTREYQAWRDADDRLAERLGHARELAREADLLRHGVAEIAAVAPRPGEDAELRAVASRLARADALRLAVRTAHDALLGDADDPASDAYDVTTLLGIARRALDAEVADDPQLAAIRDRIVELSALTGDVGTDLVGYAGVLDADPARLAEVEDRRAALAALTRKYGPEIDDVLAWAADATVRLADLDVSDEALAALAARRDELAAETLRRGLALREQRRIAADRLGQAVSAELAGLAMPNPELLVAFWVRPRTDTPLRVDGQHVAAGPDGLDEVEMLLRPGRDAPPLPLQRGASGGELSRIMLALEVSLGAGADDVPTLIFDEVDAGVGGRAAVEVGRRLARLATTRQVIVVTHLAQVAAYAGQHVVIDKPVDDDTGGVSALRVVQGPDRVAELARMLAGRETETAREHATELLAAAAADLAAGTIMP
jgi:DNA repair protein RecN (Recombination protein N)